MTTSALARLIALCPPPARPRFATGDREAARAALGWSIPDHVFELHEIYGEVSWMDWLLMPSPFTDEGRTNMANSAPSLEGVAADPAALVAFSDPEEALVFVGEDGGVSVSTSAGVTATGRTLAEVLLGWLDGTDPVGLPAPAELTCDAEIPPHAVPLRTEERPGQIAWLLVRGGAGDRASRWAALRDALGASRRISVTGEGERRQDKVYVDDLELFLTYDTCNVRDGVEQVHLQLYRDRTDEVKVTVERALAAAGLELVRVEGPRGKLPW